MRIPTTHWMGLTLACMAFASTTIVETEPALAQNAPAPFAGPPSAQIEQQLQAAQKQLLARTPEEAKLTSNLRLAVRGHQGIQPGAPGHPIHPYVALPGQTPSPNGEVVIIEGDITPALHDFIVSQGASEITEIPEYHAMSARVPLQNMLAVAGRPEVHNIALAKRPVVNQVAPPSGLPHADLDGDAAHEGESVRKQFAADGTGQKVCVISNGADLLAKSQALGTIPEVDVVPPQPGQRYQPGQEGTAMLEIVHQIAPGAKLGFADAGDSRIMMAANIRRLIARSCTIIVDDITYPDETPFQDGEVSRAAREAADKGILYFSSAANSGNFAHGESGTWEGDFHASAYTVTLPHIDLQTNTVVNQVYVFHDFGSGSIYNLVTATDPQHQSADLTWNDPVYSTASPSNLAPNDYLLVAFDFQGQIVALSSASSGSSKLPLQSVPIQPGYRLAVLKNQSNQDRVVRIVTNRGRLALKTNGQTFGHNALGATNAFSIAAVSVQGRAGPFRTNGNDRQASTIDINDYSSDGPRRIYYDASGQPLSTNSGLTYNGGTQLQKPDFAAADCVTTSVPGFAPFCGTSAAAPHAAAIAALIRSALPTADIRKAFADTALLVKGMTGPTGPTTTLGSATWNYTAGFGLLNPVLAMQRALDDQAIAVESFSETGPIRVSGNTGCGIFTVAGGAAPVANGGGWLVPKGGNVWVLCKGLRGSANIFESKMTLNIEPSAAKGTWYVSINRYRAGTRETIVNNWGWYHDFTSRFDGIWSIKIDELPVAEQSKPIDVYVNIQPSAGVENLTMQRLRIGPPGKL